MAARRTLVCCHYSGCHDGICGHAAGAGAHVRLLPAVVVGDSWERLSLWGEMAVGHSSNVNDRIWCDCIDDALLAEQPDARNKPRCCASHNSSLLLDTHQKAVARKRAG